MFGSGDDPRGRFGRDALAWADALHNLARYLTGNDADADDLVQEAYARAMGSAGSFRAGSNLKAWLFRILRNAWLDHERRRGNDPAKPGGGLLEADPPDESAELLRDDLELTWLRRLVAADIEAALRQLGEEARTVILLDLEGLRDVEIAEVMACSVGTVKSRLSRARVTLRRELRAYRGR
jgi:RNA polymerase sigma-70 factor (ECF subfamily)